MTSISFSFIFHYWFVKSHFNVAQNGFNEDFRISDSCHIPHEPEISMAESNNA